MLFTLLNEGGDIYGMEGDLADKALIDDVTMIYMAAVSTTNITINNIFKYIHMDVYHSVKAKLLTEIDGLMAFETWDEFGNTINHDLLLSAVSYEKI